MKKTLYLFLAIALTFSSCKKEEGCTDSQATNYNADAEEEDASCVYSLTGVWETTSAQKQKTQHHMQNQNHLTHYYVQLHMN